MHLRGQGRPWFWSPRGALLIVALAMALGGACQHRASAPIPITNVYVGPVPLTDVARGILGAAQLARYSEPVVPFTVVVAELGLPAGASAVQCLWEAGVLRHHRPLYADAQAARVARTERQEMLDAGLPLRDVDWDESMGVSTHGQQAIASARFDGRLAPMAAPLGPDPEARRTYRTSFLCAEGNRAALLLDYLDAPLDGQGVVLIFTNDGGAWRLVDVQGKWLA